MPPIQAVEEYRERAAKKVEEYVTESVTDMIAQRAHLIDQGDIERAKKISNRVAIKIDGVPGTLVIQAHLEGEWEWDSVLWGEKADE